MKPKFIITLLAISLLAGCAAGPGTKHARPSVTPPAAFRGSPATNDNTSLADLQWFEVFRDEHLQELIRTALKNNDDLRAATVRIEAAQAAVGITRADQFPQAGGSADITTLRIASNGSIPLPPGFDQKRTFGSLALNLLSFEFDLWGRLRRATDAARANLLATEENRRTVVSVLVSEVAAAYFNLLSLDEELDIAKRTLETRRQSLDLIRKREERGLASILELRQGEQLVHAAAAVIPGIEERTAQAENQLSLLLGDTPHEIQRGLRLTEQVQPPEVPPGLPSQLLARRPDIRAAERNLTAAHAQIDVARAAYFPRIGLTSLLGTQSDQLTGLFSGPSGMWQFVPQLSQPIFTGGRLRSNVQFAQAQERAAVVEYERAVRTAFREVSDALAAREQAHKTRAFEEELVTTLRDRSRLSYLRYRGGVDTLLEALDADRDLFGAELGLAQARRDELLASVQLYRALGGGWQ